MGSFFLAGKAFGTGKHPKGKAIDKGICQRTDAGFKAAMDRRVREGCSPAERSTALDMNA